MKEWNELTDSDYELAVELGVRYHNRFQNRMRGQMVTVADSPTYHIVMEAIKIFKEKNVIGSVLDKKKVFLGGTCNDSTWRDELILSLNIDYFNPVVDDWTPECQEEELRQREKCDFCLYTITPKMTGVYSIAEVVDDSNKRPDKTILLILEDDDDETFSPHEIKSLQMVFNMVIDNGGYGFRRMKDLIEFLNKEE